MMLVLADVSINPTSKPTAELLPLAIQPTQFISDNMAALFTLADIIIEPLNIPHRDDVVYTEH